MHTARVNAAIAKGHHWSVKPNWSIGQKISMGTGTAEKQVARDRMKSKRSSFGFSCSVASA